MCAPVAENCRRDRGSPPESIVNNSTGDWEGVDLEQADADRPAGYRGRHLYRSSTTAIDLRNIGVGR